MSHLSSDPIFPICDLFSSIQGEGTWSGRPMVFLRFWGCPLSCSWCDEPLHKDPNARIEMSIGDILKKIQQSTPHIPTVLLTGGEPLAVKELPQLISSLKKTGKWLAMESSGIGYDIPDGLDWLTISPKKTVAKDKMLRADELKFIVGPHPSDEQKADINHWAANHPNVWLQPVGDGDIPNPQATKTALELVMASQGRLRLSTQIHKYLKIP
ncbi:MAG: 7-carboxy-7-deazaguanine synthase QueE [Magnetococcales bacterium]|nr:7-carboxy-7-deazaguanine synthase QueE [Magnetococcales bacterium]